MPTRNAIAFHQNRGDQDVLIKFYAPQYVLKPLLPKTFKSDGIRYQDAANLRHAEIARILKKDAKSAEGRIREGTYDTADFKMEAQGCLRAGHIFKDLEAGGFKVLQAIRYQKARSAGERQRLEDKFGEENVDAQYVVEIRLVHMSMYETKLIAFEAAGEKGLAPHPMFMQDFRDAICPTMWGACTVFSNNTATVDPTITVNFRNPPYGGKLQELCVLEQKLQWREVR